MTIKELHKKHEDSEAKRVLLEAEMETLKAQEMQLREEAEALAEAGNVAAYKKKMATVRDVSDTIYVKEKLLKQLNEPDSFDDVIEAWNQYYPGEAKHCKELLDKYLEARKAAASLIYEYYDEVLKLHRERKELARYSNVPQTDVLRLALEIVYKYGADLQFYNQCKEYSDEQAVESRHPASIMYY